MSSVEEASPSVSQSAQSKKRKRNEAPEDALEIDVSLPEPLSKKASRKAKKHKHGESRSSQTTSTEPRILPTPFVNDDENAPSQIQSTAATTAATKSTSPHSIWIGNLPFTITKPLLRTFLTTKTEPTIAPTSITRIHIPAPARATATRTTLKPQNKGFAYVDFADQASFLAALALSETPIAGRNVLIKDAKNFVGRPVHDDGDAGNGISKTAAKTQKLQKPPSPRVFVGNLGFDVTREGLRELYTPCGEVVDVHVATFEDSGKCKGYAWVTFGTVEAAGLAVQGWMRVRKEDSKPNAHGDDGDRPLGQDRSDDDEDDAADETAVENITKSTKTQKWFVNRIQGRPIRCEYAEDPSIRYKKRFGKEAPDKSSPRVPRPRESADENLPPPPMNDATETGTADQSNGTREARQHPFGLEPGAPTDASKRRGRGTRPLTEKDKRREAKAKEIQEKTRYRSGAVAESTGSKVVFE